MQINLLRTALHELAASFKDFDRSFEPEAWPFVDDPDDHFAVMKRLINLAEIVYALGVAVDDVAHVDVRSVAMKAREFVQAQRRDHTEGWSKPAGRSDATRAKEQLVKLVSVASQHRNWRHILRTELERKFVVEAAVDPGLRVITASFGPSIRNPSKIRPALQRAVARVPTEYKGEPEVVIKTIWLALGAKPSFVSNLFSYEDQRLVRQARPRPKRRSSTKS